MMTTMLCWFMAVFQTAQPGYSYEFPRDHFAHEEYQTEWWYYTGNLQTAQGRQFGFELTFFRFARYADAARRDSAWETRDVYLAHLALTDVAGKRFYHAERINRAGPGLAGASLEQKRYWNGNWEVRWSEERQTLSAVTDQFRLALEMRPAKPFVIHGAAGLSRKSATHGSHYISYPRLDTKGTIQIAGETYAVTGVAWRDQEFFSGDLDKALAGWDWFSIHLNNGDDLMLYRLRNEAGRATEFSAGTYVDAQGHTTALASGDLHLTPGKTWHSAATGAWYPVEWQIAVPKLGLTLAMTPELLGQELVSTNHVAPSYWEGAVTFTGTARGRPTTGQGYLEMTGYNKRLQFGDGAEHAVR